MHFNPSPQFAQNNQEARKRPQLDLSSMDDEHLKEYRKGVVWQLENRPNEKTSYEEELRRVDEAIQARTSPTLH